MSGNPDFEQPPDATTETTPAAPLTLERHVVHAAEGTLVVLDHQVKVRRPGSERILALRASEIRRVQLDIEQGRPATVAIVPNSRSKEAFVLTVEREEFERLAGAILHLAADLDDVSRSTHHELPERTRPADAPAGEPATEWTRTHGGPNSA